MLLDFGFLTEEASRMHKIFNIWCHDKKKILNRNFFKIWRPRPRPEHQFARNSSRLKGRDCSTGVPNFNSISQAINGLWWFEKLRILYRESNTFSDCQFQEIRIYFILYLYVQRKARHRHKFQQPLQKVVNPPKTPKNRVKNFSRPSNFLYIIPTLQKTEKCSQKPQNWGKQTRDKYIYVIRSYLAKSGKISQKPQNWGKKTWGKYIYVISSYLAKSGKII